MNKEIVSVKIKNVLAIGNAEIKPGQINQIVGQNNNGKTSFLKAIKFLAEGSTDVSLVKIGETEAEVMIEMSDKTTIKRTLNDKGKQSLDVRGENGFKAPQPQSMLDGLFSSAAFNPLELLDPKKRTDAIMKSIDIKVTEEQLISDLKIDPKLMPPVDYNQHGLKVLETVHKYFYQRRAEANKITEEKAKYYEVEKAKLPATAPTVELTDEQIEAKYSELNASTVEQNKLIAIASEKTANHYAIDKKRDELAKQVEEYAKKISDAQIKLGAMNEQLNALTKQVEESAKTLPDVSAANAVIAKNREELAALEAKKLQNQLAKSYKDSVASVESRKAEYNEAQKIATSLDEAVKLIVGPIKKKALESVELPMTGMTYNGGEFLVEGASIDNLSTSKKIKLGVAIARKLAGGLKLICIDGAEQLDAQTWKEFHDEISGDGYTYFVTRVGSSFDTNDKVITMKAGEIAQ